MVAQNSARSPLLNAQKEWHRYPKHQEISQHRKVWIKAEKPSDLQQSCLDGNKISTLNFVKKLCFSLGTEVDHLQPAFSGEIR